jgi:hypothetical protein
MFIFWCDLRARVLNLELLDTLLKFIGAIASVGGGLVAIVYVTFKFLASKWIDNRFATSLEAFRGPPCDGRHFKLSRNESSASRSLGSPATAGRQSAAGWSVLVDGMA